MNTIMLWVIQTSAEITLGILIEKLLSDANRKRTSKFLKYQILVLYLNWVLLKTPLIPRNFINTLNSNKGSYVNWCVSCR
ncbi:hypothetical protein NIES4073_24860 [Kalymmatonema gypsitolerans NIES-4073]|nr:hypothetical protein NIES4073_24860 [Scytonema sp. NIES-4073]